MAKKSKKVLLYRIDKAHNFLLLAIEMYQREIFECSNELATIYNADIDYLNDAMVAVNNATYEIENLIEEAMKGQL